MKDDALSPRPRKAVGPERPAYLDGADVDRVMAVLLALVSETAAIRERLDTHERLAASGVMPSPERVESYVASADAEREREAWRDATIRRLFRVFTEDVDGLRGSDGPGG
jgi:hypothetical protein